MKVFYNYRKTTPVSFNHVQRLLFLNVIIMKATNKAAIESLGRHFASIVDKNYLLVRV